MRMLQTTILSQTSTKLEYSFDYYLVLITFSDLFRILIHAFQRGLPTIVTGLGDIVSSFPLGRFHRLW